MREEDLAAHNAAMGGDKPRRRSFEIPDPRGETAEAIDRDIGRMDVSFHDPLHDGNEEIQQDLRICMKKGEIRKEHRALLKGLEHQTGIHKTSPERGPNGDRGFYMGTSEQFKSMLSEVQDTRLFPQTRLPRRFQMNSSSSQQTDSRVAALPPLGQSPMTPQSGCSSLPTLRQASNLRKETRSTPPSSLPLSPLGKSSTKFKLPQIGTPS